MNAEFPRTTYERADHARFILDAALALGIRVGTDGEELVLVAPLKVPRETRRWFETKLDEFRAEVIDFIQRENAARPGAVS
jgi:hypothetical protein